MEDDDFSSDVTTTGRAIVDGTVTGSIEIEDDRDWFSVELSSATAYRIDLEGAPTSRGTNSDVYLYGVYTSEGERIPNTVNDDFIGLNSRVTFQPESSGTYFINTGAYLGNIGTYSLSLTTLIDDFSADVDTTATLSVGGSASGSVLTQTDTDWFAISLEEGETYRFDAIDTTFFFANIEAVFDADGELVPGTGSDRTTDLRTLDSLENFTAPSTDTYYVSVSSRGGTGDYTVEAARSVNVIGTAQNDWLTLPDGSSEGLVSIRGGSGVDMMSFTGLDGAVFVNTHTDNATLTTGAAPFSINMDSIENVTGTGFNDIFVGSDRSEIFRGLSGDDRFFGSDHADVIHGGGGRDTLTYETATDGVSVSLLRGRGWEGDALGDRISNVENFFGSNFDDFIWGDNDNNRLEGGNGDDVIMGNGGNDYILAGFGTDVVQFSGNQADYTIVRDGIRTDVTDNVGADGTDIIGHVEILRFADGDLML
jgi:Ca2+-binding RTX toxin-like protein